MDRMRCGILGATGMIGQRFVTMLHEHPWFDLCALYSSRADGGRRYSDVVSWMLGPDIPGDVGDIPLSDYGSAPAERSDVDIVFSALPAEAASRIERGLSRSGVHVVSNSSYHRMDRDVPLIVPEVNGDHLGLLRERGEGGVLVTNPNCTTIGMVMALDPVRDLLGGPVHVSSYQAISGAGYPGVASLDISGNVHPFIMGEEEKLGSEAVKIMGSYKEGGIKGAGITVVPNCVRVPVRDGHLISISVKVKEVTDPDEVVKRLRSKTGLVDLPSAPERPLVLRMEPDRPRPDLDAFAGDPPGMVVSVGRVRVEEGFLRMFSLVNNTIRGGAGNSVLIAEQCVREGYL